MIDVLIQIKSPTENPGYNDTLFVIQDNSIVYACPGSRSPNHRLPWRLGGLHWNQKYGRIAKGNYFYEVINHHKYGKCLLLNKGGKCGSDVPNPTQAGEFYLTELLLHKGYSETCRGSAGCPHVHPLFWNSFLYFFLSSTPRGVLVKTISDAWYYADLCAYYPDGTEALLNDGEFLALRGRPDFAYIFLDHSHNKAWFVAQGTDHRDEWIANLRCLTNVDGKFVAWHDTFLLYFQPKLVEVFNRYPEYDWFFTGHSRGGGLAGNAAAYIADTFRKPVSCITFGEPAWVTKKGRDYVNKLPIDYTWVCNGWDIVCSLPPFGFHPGKKFHIKRPFWHRLMYFRIDDHTNYGRAIRDRLKKKA